jgi:hypothetical protein
VKKALLAFLSILTFAGCEPTTPPPMLPVPPPPRDMASPADQLEQPRLTSVSPTVAHSGTTALTITAVGLDLEKVQAGLWSFGVCPVDAYTYTPIDARSCRLSIQVGRASALSCDLSLRIANRNAAPPLIGAFSLAP